MDILKLVKQEMDSTDIECMEVKVEEHQVKTEPCQYQSSIQSKMVNYN